MNTLIGQKNILVEEVDSFSDDSFMYGNGFRTARAVAETKKITNKIKN